MSINESIKQILKVGGSVSVDGTPCGSAAELAALMKAAGDEDGGLMRLLALDLESIAETVRVNENLPAMAKPKGYPKHYRPEVNVHPNGQPFVRLRWR